MLRIVWAVPVLALALGLVAACESGGTTTGAASTAPSQTPTPSPDETHDHNPYQEAAQQFGLTQATIEKAVVDARVEMLVKGGPEGKALAGGGHLDPAILRLFAERLGIPGDRAEQVMKFLIEEWDEYDEHAELQNPGVYDEWAAYVSKELKVTVARAEWLGKLMFSRPFVADPGQKWDRIFVAIARDVGVTPERLAEIVDALKSR